MGSGNGTIQMSGGTLATDGTTTFNFGGALFQWTGEKTSQAGGLTNTDVDMTALQAVGTKRSSRLRSRTTALFQ